jgi:hypothetical protein
MEVLTKAGDDRRKADRAVSMVVMAGEEPVGSARILGSNMVELCVWLRWFLLSSIRCLSASMFDFRLSAASAITLGTSISVGNESDGPEHSLSLLHLQLQHLISIGKYF